MMNATKLKELQRDIDSRIREAEREVTRCSRQLATFLVRQDIGETVDAAAIAEARAVLAESTQNHADVIAVQEVLPTLLAEAVEEAHSDRGNAIQARRLLVQKARDAYATAKTSLDRDLRMLKVEPLHQRVMALRNLASKAHQMPDFKATVETFSNRRATLALSSFF